MKKNKILPAIAAFVLCLTFLSISSEAQKRRPVKRAAKPAAETATILPSLEIKQGAEKVSTQLKNVSKFIYVLGSVANGIEDIDKNSRKMSRTVNDQNQENKQKLIQTIQNLRAGLAALEVEFRTKPALKNYLFQINGITDISGNAEDEASSGQFIQSGRTLLLVIDKLTDTLAALP